MTTVSLHYWAGARAAAGLEVEEIEASSVAEALDAARARRGDDRFDRVLGMCSLLIDGTVASGSELTRQRTDPVTVEILPPFAGGTALRPA